ncbi:hypothetical protein FPV58_19510 [Mycolicibacterium porcinum]|uniref:sensor histidine kinase n=1 Tax=Mycolicibacterium porcinum TaxID=39693 RepID=UPI00119766E9|nr:ATP-binding protein [Mycolicibacterium porcinum]TVX98906.1 hypothetical protein FPV58_19510 [Mycolicibacterium porcinum]
MSREGAVRVFLDVLVECGFRRARYYEVDTQTPLLVGEDAGFEELAVLVRKSGEQDDDSKNLRTGFSIPWTNTALALDGREAELVVTESEDFLARHPECGEWVDALNLHGRSWFDLPIIRDGQTVGLVAADWDGPPDELDDSRRNLLKVHGHCLGSGTEAPNAIFPLDIRDTDVDAVVDIGCREMMTRIDAMFAAIFRYDWRTNTLVKIREYHVKGRNAHPVPVVVDEPNYAAGVEYLTGRAWSDEQYRYVASLDNLAQKKTEWIERVSKRQREGLSGAVTTKTVLYKVVGKKERRYLLRFINRSDAPDLPFLRRRRELVEKLATDLAALVDLTVSDGRIDALRTIARHAVDSIHIPKVTAEHVANAIQAEGVDDFIYVAFRTGVNAPTFVHSTGAFVDVQGKAEQLVESIRRRKAPHLEKHPDTAGQFEVRSVALSELTIIDDRRFDECLWVDAQAGDTTGILLTTCVSTPPIAERAPSELRLLQTYCDLLTSSIEAMTTYISRDGAHRALGYIGHEIGTPFIIMGESATLIALENLEVADAIRQMAPRLAADLSRKARMNYKLIGRQRDEIDRVMSVAPLLANMGSGELSMYLEETDVGAVFNEARERLMTETRGRQPSGSTAKGRKPAPFVIRISDSMARLPIVVCDDGLILQAATNVLRNAIKYSLPRHAPDPMVITVSGRIIDEKHCAVTVENWGFGIPEEIQSSIFLPFVRGQIEDRLKSLPGMGIGLWLVATIMSAHKGQVLYRSAPTLDDPKRTELLEGFLTTFELRFRRDLTAGPQTVEIRSSTRSASRGKGGRHHVGD